ncbi:MAG TPA: C4-dicarboxylate ABC transporter substrate-binding protein, partial [Burkholderiaceae bacterium]|nr:C4-dicarboxylate ABC transporter substrate-binding protein [Burkholderiaceae bacterium]
RSIHGEAGWFQRRGEFPSERSLEWPLAREAERTLRSGTPWLQRYLPFWLSNLIDRMWVVLLSIVAVLIPLSRVVPPLYEFKVRSRIFRWYAQLRDIEDSVDEREDTARRLLERLDQLDARVERLTVPLSYADELYALRSHIQLVRGKVTRGAAPAPNPVPVERANR